MPIARSLKWENDMEFHDVFPLFSQKAAQVCSIKWLMRMMNEDDKKYWIYGKVVGVETPSPFGILRASFVEKVLRWWTAEKSVCTVVKRLSMTFQYDLDGVVADGTGVINLSLSDGASTRLIGEDTHDVIAYQGSRVKTLQTFIEDEILGKCALFEVIFRSKSTVVRRFNVSRLSEDEEVFEQYELKYLPNPKEREEVEAGGRCKTLQPLKRRRIV
ncbi:hypothetical protein CASFOL_017859 [Castilleja foliolosa]|uniref:Uncharacterized protein n=1 Tax=Castilleja foliolosa TaxID=1961234 RepID=A0ABD3D842_9LAMI